MDDQLPQERPASGGTRKHMGVATSDPEYLPPVGHGRGTEHAMGAPSAVRGHGDNPHRTQAPSGAQPNYGRYISTPKKGRSIFTSRQDRQRRRVKILLGVLIIAATALALFWFFVLR